MNTLQSRLNTQVQYREKREIDDADIGHMSAVYSLSYFENPVIIVLGKQNFTYIHKNIVFYPIYIVDKDTIRSQIGIFELDKKNAIKILDEEGDVIISKAGDPLLYSFVTPEFVAKTNSDVDVYLSYTKRKMEKAEDTDSLKKKISDMEQEISFETGAEFDSSHHDILSLAIPKDGRNPEQLERAVEILKNGIFETDTQTNAPASLIEESESIARTIKSEYKEGSKTNWLQDFMKNPNYDIYDVEANGDCFFAVIREAFRQIGQNTTVDKLRALLASEVTDDIFQENRRLYLANLSKKNEYLNEIKTAEKAIADLKMRLKNTKTLSNKDESDAILKEAVRQKERIVETKIFLKEVQDLEDNYVGFMKTIDSLDKFREYIQTPAYWADAWAISTLEHLLNIKMIIFSEKAFSEGAHPSVMNCGEVNINIEKKGSFAPTYYIMTTYSGDHYRLISYKQKRILSFPEIPYDVKILIVNKCIERNSGVYYYIQDFRNFESRLGLDVETLNPNTNPIEIAPSDLYDPAIVFMFHAKSQKTAKPGKGSHEAITADRITEFVPLSTISDWRRKLDDEWVLPKEDPLFTLDGYRWASVEHYYQAAKFRKRNPQFTKEFALDSNSEISKSVALAKIAGSKSGRSKEGVLRPKTISIDPDFYEGERNLKERAAAVDAKFMQNEEMRKILKLTTPAKLVQYVHSGQPEEDIILMQVRSRLP
jgi:predicted NAD-dependent protein-ADP-ribosyltransferase YbiA (DUF1768 family)